MSLKKLNMNSMKVASPMSADALSLLDNLNSIYSQKDLVDSNNITNFDEETNDERDEIIDIEVCEEFKTITDMATLPTKEEIKELGAETALVYMCLKLDKNDAEIMDRLSITSNRLNKHYNKLSEFGYIKRSIILLERESALNVPQNAPSEIIETVIEKVQEEPIIEHKTDEDVFQTVPKKNEDILNDLYHKDYMNSHSQQNKKGDVFNYTNKDRAFDFEKEQFPKKKNNFIVTI